MQRTAMAAAILMLAACAGESDEELPAPEPQPTTTTTRLDNGLVDGFYPVQTAIPDGCAADAEAFPARTGPECYILGLDEVVPLRQVVESAEAQLDASGNWTVDLRLTDDGIDRFNELAAMCFEGADTVRCPTGQVAIAVAGAVVSAPTINEPSFERDQIQIAGDFSEDEADEIAESFEP